MRILRRSHVAACAVVVWLMVLSAAATELYYESPDNDSEYQIENANKLESAAYEQLKSAEDELRKSRLLVTLLQYVQNIKEIKDADNKSLSPKVEDEDVTWSDLFGLKEADVKRWLASITHNANSKLMPRWKIKKGTSIVCYFKLCSFKRFP